MLSWNEVERKLDAMERGSHDSVHLAIVLSMVMSLTAVAILSKQHLTNEALADVAACVVPLPLALYFRSRIVLLGFFPYVAVLTVALIAAILFGI